MTGGRSLGSFLGLGCVLPLVAFAAFFASSFASAIASYRYDATFQVVAATHNVARAAHTATTRLAIPCTDDTRARSSPRTSPGVVRVVSGRFLAAKGGEELATGRFLRDSWHRATFPNKCQGRRNLGRSRRSKTRPLWEVSERVHPRRADVLPAEQGARTTGHAEGWFGRRSDRDQGGPGGYFTPDGNVVSFWYP